VDASRAGQWDIVAVASAGRQRDRDLWAGRRLLLSMMLAAGLVLSFGGVAMRTQRKELVLERELALAGARRQRDERLEQATRAAVVGTFAIGIAHEISTPLGVIAARAEQIQTRGGPDRLAGPAGVILAQVDEIKRVVRAFLGLARGDAPSAEKIRPDLLTRTAAKLVEHRFEKAGVALRYDALPHLPSILGDPKLLEQAIVNLLLNACDASGPGRQVHLFVDQADGEVAITVDDEGPGISAADAQRAMQPFLAGAAQVRADGSGLGLAIAHEIVANHRGTLALSAARAGTRATIRLPALAPVGVSEGGRV
jgi:signal transduction histidine kinase